MTNYNVYQRQHDGTAIKVGRSIQSNPYAAEKAIAALLGVEMDNLFAKQEFTR